MSNCSAVLSPADPGDPDPSHPDVGSTGQPERDPFQPEFEAVVPAEVVRTGPVSRAARLRRMGRDAGMTTAEYAIGTLAACGFAALLVTILRSGEVQGLLTGIIRRALSMG